MLIGLLSDSHAYMDDAALEHLQDVDEIWHAGDWGNLEVEKKLASLGKPILGVYGNIDGYEIRSKYPEELVFTKNELKFYMVHIGGYPGRYNALIKNKLLEQKPDVFICGHSHILKVMNDKDLHLIHLNPGAIGKEGFHKVRTMLKFEIGDKKLQNLRVIEFNK